MGDDKREERTQDESRPSIKVTDRRHFTAAGERRLEFSEEEETSPASEAAAATPERPAEGQEAGFQREPLEEPQGINFTMLVNAMAQPALLFLGEIPHPSTGERSLDPEQARIQIDLLDLLRVKCRGNLSPEEEGLLERVLYELRMLYVARTSGPGSPGSA